MSDNSSLEKKKYLKELVTNQLKTVPPNRRLIYKDLARITKYIDSSIFDDECCIWDGYITNAKNAKKGTYINFFFRNKKVALHRLLYENFVGTLSDDYYLKFSCENEENKGKCCNVNHMLKYKYNACIECGNDNTGVNQAEKNDQQPVENNKPIVEQKKENFIVTFD
jgi:hypothetical protein